MYRWGRVRIRSTIIFHQSNLWKARFFILCDVILLARLQGKFDIDHSWEWKGYISTRGTGGSNWQAGRVSLFWVYYQNPLFIEMAKIAIHLCKNQIQTPPSLAAACDRGRVFRSPISLIVDEVETFLPVRYWMRRIPYQKVCISKLKTRRTTLVILRLNSCSLLDHKSRWKKERISLIELWGTRSWL